MKRRCKTCGVEILSEKNIDECWICHQLNSAGHYNGVDKDEFKKSATNLR